MTTVTEAVTSRVCTLTGLQLIRPPSTPLHRVSPRQYGPLNPQLRGSDKDRSAWGRWDAINARTIYAAASALASFAEVVAYEKENLPTTPLGDLFDDAGLFAGQSFAAIVRSEMPCPEMRDAITKGWRDERFHHQLSITGNHWLIDITAAESLASINAAFTVPGQPSPGFTLADLTGEDRYLTTTIATWIRSRSLDDGSLPLGIAYPSKHGKDLESYGLWLRSTDDGNPDAEPIKIANEAPINRDDDDLRRAVKLHQMGTVW